MPLNPVYLPKVDGLQTETSNINSDPRSLADCTDVISNREDFLESRHGHPSAPVVTSVNGSAVDLYAYRNTTNKVFVPMYKVSNVYQFKAVSQTGEEITGGSTESSLQNINGISTTRTSQVNVKPTAFAHDERLLFLTDYGVYFRPYSIPGAAAAAKAEFPLIRTATVEALWRASSNYGGSDLKAENAHWLVPGFQVNVKIVFEIEAKEGNKGERRLASPTSRAYEVKNFNLTNNSTSTRTSNMLVKLSGITVSNIPAGHAVYMKVYRTPQFEIGTAAITQYFLAIEEKDITASIPSELYLTTNDDGIVQLEPLYNDPTQGGTSVTNHIPIPAKNVTQFRNYYIYSNLGLPTLTSFGIKDMPANNDVLTIKVSGASGVVDRTHQITFKTSGASSTVTSGPSSTGEVNIPANATSLSNDYIATENDLTFQGKRSSSIIDRIARIYQGSSTGKVESYGKITKMQFMNKNGNNAVVRITADSIGFDINRFKQPGVAAIVNSTGQVQTLFSYSSYKRVASSIGFIDFEGAVSVGEPMPADQTATLYMYCINVENLETTIKTDAGADTTASNLDLYRADGSSYFSLLPCKNGLPFPVAKPAADSTGTVFKYSNSFVTLTNYSYAIAGTVVTVNTSSPHSFTAGQSVMISSSTANIDGVYTLASASGSTFTFVKNLGGTAISSTAVSGFTRLSANNELLVNPEYVGLLTKPQGKLYDDLALAIAQNAQNGFNQTGAIIAFNGGDLIETGVVSAEILDYQYEKIEFQRTGVDAYEPPINSGSYTEFAISEKAVSAFIISKENNPELIPYSGIKTPTVAGPFNPPKVGDPNKAIVACASTKDSVYLLKEDGVARVFVGFGALVPTIDGINIFDNTTFCVSAGSVQVLNDSVLFLAQNGVHAISGNNIDKVSRQIETELKKAISQCRSASRLDDIRSFANSAKGLYGLYIPTGVTSYVTYVLNIATMRWTKWSNAFNGAVIDQDGRLTTLVTAATENYIRQDRYTNGDPRAEIDQIDDEFVLTGTGSDVGLVRTISSQTGLGTQVLRFGSKQAYYKAGTTLYPVTVAANGTNGAVITFQSTPPTYSASNDSVVVGVNMMLEFQPFTNNNPSTLKMFSGYHTHTEESVLDLAVSFRTEARSVFSTVKTFSTSPDNRTVYRCYIPLEATRGRFLYRKLTHVRPYQICAIPAQTIVHRETGSERVNK